MPLFLLQFVFESAIIVTAKGVEAFAVFHSVPFIGTRQPLGINNQKEKEKEMEEITKQESTYEEELKALKEKWVQHRKDERESKKIAEKSDNREKAKENVAKALEFIQSIDSTIQRKELACVIKRLYMFLDGERYTRKR